jgi:hypothetical protein
MSEAFLGNASVSPSHSWFRTPSVISTISFTGTTGAAPENVFGFPRSAAAISYPLHARPITMALTMIVLSAFQTTRRRPSTDMARGFTCWGISLQLRAFGAFQSGWLTTIQASLLHENAAARV